MLANLRIRLLKALKPITIWIGQRHMPYSHKLITGKHYFEIVDRLSPGVVFVTQKYGELTNILIPGKWTHAAIYVGDGWVVEALGVGVTKTHIIDFLLSKDEVAVLSPKFGSEGQMAGAAKYALGKVGTPYDYEFKGDNQAFYCSELVWSSYDQVMQEMPFTIRKTWGVETVIPDDIYNAKSKWTICWEANR